MLSSAERLMTARWLSICLMVASLALVLCWVAASTIKVAGLNRKQTSGQNSHRAAELQAAALNKANSRWGSLKGQVALEGPLPEIKSFNNVIGAHRDGIVFLKGKESQFLDPTWQVDTKSRGVANVVVFLLPPAGATSLPIHDDDKKRTDTIVLDTPTCAYVPHVVALYPEWKSGDESGKTGQKFFISCSRKERPGFMFRLDVDPLMNKPFDLMMAPGQKTEVFLNRQEKVIPVRNDFHGWMKAYIWVFGHPYFAVTKEDGSFTLPRVPAGIDVRLIAWHEAAGKFYVSNTRFDQGENTIDIRFDKEGKSR
jgi:hypothetical protein